SFPCRRNKRETEKKAKKGHRACSSKRERETAIDFAPVLLSRGGGRTEKSLALHSHMSVERLQRCRVKLRSWLVKEEEEISQAITDAQSKSSSRLERSQCKFLAEDELERAILMLKETLDEPPDALKKDVATALEVLEMERNALLKEMRASSPPYMLHLVEAKDIIHQVQDPAGEEPCRVPPTMAPNLENRWKSLVLELLHESKRGMERRWQGTELAGPAGLIKHVQANIYTLDIPHVLKGVREAYDRACKIEAEHDRCLDTSLKALHKINQEIEIQRASLDSLGRGATLAERVKKVEEARQAARNTGKGVGIDEGMKNAGGSLPPQGLQQVKRLDRTPGRSLADYQQMITQCGDRGEPLTAMAAYESMIRHQWKPTHHTFWHLLRAFKNARPPRPMQALQVLDEMKIQGVVVMTKHYNQVVDCCKSSGQWRVA
ncbi:unnamed protein product, partial [Chrysoparadoxa australica]